MPSKTEQEIKQSIEKATAEYQAKKDKEIAYRKMLKAGLAFFNAEKLVVYSLYVGGDYIIDYTYKHDPKNKRFVIVYAFKCPKDVYNYKVSKGLLGDRMANTEIFNTIQFFYNKVSKPYTHKQIEKLLETVFVRELITNDYQYMPESFRRAYNRELNGPNTALWTRR